MSNIRSLISKNIYVFDENLHKHSEANSLKEFLYFLKFKDHNEIVDFSCSNGTDSLHHKLTIKENFMLDSIPASLIRNDESNLNEFLNTIKNPYLVDLVEKLGLLSQKVSTLSPEKIKLTSIIKSLISASEYVILIKPEDYQTSKTINTLIKCIEFETKHNLKNIFIAPKNFDIWLATTTCIISKCQKTHQYIETKNPLNESNQSFKPTYNFSLSYKKAS